MLAVPFAKENQLSWDLDLYDARSPDLTSLPGFPRIVLKDESRVRPFLEDELRSEDTERFAPWLWILSTQSGANVNRLHRQQVKGRDIVLTEEVRLHLIWVRDRIFIKPLPRYLLSHKFWTLYLSGENDCCLQLRRSALGFLRSYSYLIKSESDFRVAQQERLQLVPADVTWNTFCEFIGAFDRIMDDDTSRRYHYGELRLTRLNLYAPFILRKQHFEAVHTQYAEHFARLYAPFVFIFALLSILLNGMQVTLAAEQVSSEGWTAFCAISRWFGVVVLLAVGVIALSFLLIWIWMVLDEWLYAIRARRRKRRSARAKEDESC